MYPDDSATATLSGGGGTSYPVAGVNPCRTAQSASSLPCECEIHHGSVDFTKMGGIVFASDEQPADAGG